MNQKENLDKQVIQFFLLTFLISWSIWGAVILFPGLLGEMYFLIIFGAFGPFAVAKILTFRYDGKEGTKRWRQSILAISKYVHWHLLGGLGIPLLIAIIHITLYYLIIGLPSLQTEPPWYWLIPAIPVNVFIIFVYSSAFGEEPGWQGYAMPRLLAKYHPVSSVFILGFLWTLWHIPLQYIPIWTGSEPLLLMLLYTPALGVILTWLTQKSNCSVMSAVFLHYATNLYGDYLLGTDIFVEPLSLYFSEIKTGIYWMIALFLIIRTNGRLGLE